MKRLLIPALFMLPLAGCVHHPHHYEREEVVTYDVETAPPPPPREEIIVERERPYVGAVFIRGHWDRDREHRHWVWRRGYWK